MGAGLNGMRMSGMGGGFGGGMPAAGSSSPPKAARRQAPPVEHRLNLSLEELYQGSSKRMRITKRVRDVDDMGDVAWCSSDSLTCLFVGG